MQASAPPSHVRVVACLIWILSRQPDLGICYVLARHRQYDLDDCNLLHSRSVVLLLAQWLRNENVRTAVRDGLRTMEDRSRCIADIFLVQSLVVEHIIEQNSRGLTVDLQQAIWKYAKLWSLRPTAMSVRDRLARLVWNRNARRRFGVDLRREWMLGLTHFRVARDLRPNQIRRKVLVRGRTT
jgi:hypothetical protein